MAKYVGILKSIKRFWDEYAQYGNATAIGLNDIHSSQGPEQVILVGAKDQPSVIGEKQGNNIIFTFPEVSITRYDHNYPSGKITPQLTFTAYPTILEGPAFAIEKTFECRIENDIYDGTESVHCTIPSGSVLCKFDSQGILESFEIIKPFEIYVSGMFVKISQTPYWCGYVDFPYDQETPFKKILYLSEDLSTKMPKSLENLIAALKKEGVDYWLDSSLGRLEGDFIPPDSLFLSGTINGGTVSGQSSYVVDSKMFYLEE